MAAVNGYSPSLDTDLKFDVGGRAGSHEHQT